MTHIDPFKFDPDGLTVTYDGIRVKLDAREFDVFEALASTRGIVKYATLERLTNRRRRDMQHAVMALREKIEAFWDFAYTIDCEDGQGYRLRKVEKWSEVWK